ncbi:MAG TPA: hypothetical protein VLA23_08895 [Candidatus Limnocylindrales bacterium]|nr:hypothetical protein [Candidatus Limnocylindrales bacterium]
MADTRVVLAGLWVAAMLTYLWGDVLRIMAGDVQFGRLQGTQPSQVIWLVIAALMLVPILMVVLSLIAPRDLARWANMIVAVGFLLMNLVTLPSYPPLYDKFLLAVSLVFNALTVWFAWSWTE